MVKGFDKAIGVVEWKNSFVVSKQVLEDADMGRIRNNVTQLTKGYFRGREYFARNIIGGGFTGKYSYTRQDGKGEGRLKSLIAQPSIALLAH